MNKKILELLYLSFDSDLDEKEQKQLAEALRKSEELRQEKERILAQRKAVSESVKKSFAPLFAERVITRIHALGEKENSLEILYESFKVAFQRFAIAGAVVLIALILYNLAIGDILSAEELFYASDVTFEEIFQLPLF